MSRAAAARPPRPQLASLQPSLVAVPLPAGDQLIDAYAASAPKEVGILNYSRLENR